MNGAQVGTPHRLGPRGTLLAAAAIVAIIGAYMIANREAVAEPAGRVYAAFTGAPPPAASPPPTEEPRK